MEVDISCQDIFRECYRTIYVQSIQFVGELRPCTKACPMALTFALIIIGVPAVNVWEIASSCYSNPFQSYHMIKRYSSCLLKAISSRYISRSAKANLFCWISLVQILFDVSITIPV